MLITPLINNAYAQCGNTVSTEQLAYTVINNLIVQGTHDNFVKSEPPAECGGIGDYCATEITTMVTTCFGYQNSACIAPQTWDGTMCVDPPAVTCQAGDTVQASSGTTTQTVCISGCQHNLSTVGFGLIVTNSTNQSTSFAKYVNNGVECNGSETTNTQPNNSDVTDTDLDGLPEINGQELPPTPPPSNGCVLLANGSTYCGSGAPTPPTPDNGTPGVGASPDQTVTNTSTNTTNNYYSPSTNAGSSTGTPDGQDEGVCDPSFETCGTDEESASESGCDQLPTCTGDAIQCTHMKIQHDTRCNLFVTEQQTEEEIQTAVGVTQTLEEWVADEAANPDNTIDVNDPQFGLGTTTPTTTTCPADISISVPFMATPVTLPSSPICEFLDYIRPAVIILSYLVSGLMLFSAFKNGF